MSGINRAIIIGGGIGGLSAAIALRREGIDASVCERAEELRPVGAGLTIWANAIKALDTLGLADAIRERAWHGSGGGIRSWRGEMLLPLSPRELQRQLGEVNVALHRADLQTALLDALDRDTVQLGAVCVAIEEDGTGVCARFADGREARGDLLIGADGIHSIVREQLFGKAPLHYAGYTAYRAVIPYRQGSVAPSETWGCGARFGLVPLTEDRLYWFAAVNAREGEHHDAASEKEALQKRFDGWHAPIPEVIAATPADAILRNDIYDSPPLRRWSTGRVTLLGDAAHPMTPNLGQGACQAIEDAVVLAACLRDSDDVKRALQRYQARRKPRTRAIVAQSRRMGQIGQWANPVACRLRDALLKRVPPSVQMQQIKRLLDYQF